MANDALDQSWGRVDPTAARNAGIKLVAGYLSYDSSKNWTPDWIRRYHAAGIGVLLNWEAVEDAPFQGASRGTQDATEAVRQADLLKAAVGQPGYKLSIVFSVDRDTNSSQYPALDAYFGAVKTVCHARGYLCGVYGEADLMDHLHNAGLTDVEWQTLAWSYGRISQFSDLYQSSINNTLAGSSIDYDRLLNPGGLGAWWPSGEAPASNGATEIGGDTLSSTEYTQLAGKIDALTALVKSVAPAVHADNAGTQDRTKQILAIVSGDQIPDRAAQKLSGGLPLPGAGHNLPGVEKVLKAAVHAEVEGLQQTVLAAVAAHTTTVTATPSPVDMTPVTKHLGAVVDAIHKMPADVRAELAKHLGGTA